MNFTVAKISGSLSETGWSQVHYFRPEAGEKSASHGELAAAISFKAKTEIDVSSFGSEIVKRLQEIYYSNEAVSVLTKLGQTIETLAAEFLDRVELEVTAVAGWQNYLYAARNNGGQVWLKRDNNLVKLFAENGGIETVSGKLLPGDKAVAATADFCRLVPEGGLRAALGQAEAAAAAESLTGQVHGHEDNSRAAAAVIYAPPAAPKVEVKMAVTGQKLTEKLARVKNRLSAVKTCLLELIPAKPIQVFIGPHRDRKRRLSLTVGAVFLVVFGASVILAGTKKQNEIKQQAYRELLEEVNYKLEEAGRLAELNPLRAKSLLTESQTAIDEYLLAKGKAGQELENLKEKVAQALEQAQREYQTEAAEWYDFDLVKDGFRGERWDMAEKELAVWDSRQAAAVLVNLESKAAEIIAAGDELGSVNLIGLTEGRAFAAAPEKVTVIDTKKAAVVSATEADGWQKIAAARGFGGNLYLLDAAPNGQIWKYLGLDDGLSGKRSYLAGDDYDLSEAVDMAIDGSVWVLFSDGAIVKYTQGKKDAFQTVGLDQAPANPAKLYTGPDEENLYLLDQAGMRVVVIAKTGEYAAQYRWPGIAGVKDLAAAEALGKIFLLTGEKIFTLDIKP